MSTSLAQPLTAANQPDKLTSGKRLIKNVFWNYLTQGITFGIGIVTIPPIIEGFGVERFGILSLLWAIIGYSSFLDFGLGRALTQLVSKQLGTGEIQDLPNTIWTALITIAVLSILAGLLVAGLTPAIVTYMHVTPSLQQEALNSMYWLALSLPFLIGTISLKGILESYQQFGLLNALRLPILFCNFVSPLLVLPFTRDLSVAIAVLVIARILMTFAHFIACGKVIEGFYQNICFERDRLKPLIKFGGWFTISSIVSPLMLYMDRFLIAHILTAGVIAYYTTPHSVMARMWIIPTTLMSVMFPALTTESMRDRERMRRLYFKSLGTIVFLMLIPTLVILLCGKWMLGLWINPHFAELSYPLVFVLALVLPVHSANLVSSGLIQALGRADITAKISLLEFPIYCITLFFFINQFGLLGAPLALLLRVGLDSLLLHNISLRFLRKSE